MTTKKSSPLTEPDWEAWTFMGWDGSHSVADRSSEGETLVTWAIQQEPFRRALVVDVLKAGADPNQAKEAGYAPLHLACDINARLVATLLEWGADPNLRVEGLSPLACAHRLPVLQALIAGGADVNSITCNGYTRLMSADSPDIAQALLAAGARPDVRDGRGWSALWHAGKSDQLEVFQILHAACPETGEERDAEGRCLVERLIEWQGPDSRCLAWWRAQGLHTALDVNLSTTSPKTRQRL